MTSPTTEDKLAYVFTVFKHANLPKPDYSAVAVEAGINTGSNAQRRLRSIVKAAGFDLINNQIVGPDGSTGGGDSVDTPPKKSRAKKSPAKNSTGGKTPVKKRKLSESVVDSASGEECDQQVKEEETEAVDAVKVEQNGEGGNSGED